MNQQQEFGFMDLLFFYSLFLQLSNQNEIVKGKDVQDEINNAVDKLNDHLQSQDEKINKIMEALGIENN